MRSCQTGASSPVFESELPGRDRVVWIINHYAEEPETGSGLRHFTFAKYLQRMGWRPIIFAASTVHKTNFNHIDNEDPYVEKVVDGVRFVFLRARDYWGNGLDRIYNMMDYYFGMKRRAPRFPRPDVIMASSPHPLAWHLAHRFSKQYSCPWVCETRDCWPYSLVRHGMLPEKSFVTRCMYAYEGWAYRKADAIVFTIPGGSKYVAERHPAVDSSKVFYINNGVDLSAFEGNKQRHVYCDPELSDDQYKALVYCGSVSPAYILSTMIEAMEEIRESDGGESLRLLVFGDGEDRESLEALCKDRGLCNVSFKGRVEKKYVPSILSQAYATCFSLDGAYVEEYGASPNKLFDYLASGKPVFSNVPMRYDLVKESGCGVVADSQEVNDIADALIRLASLDGESYDKMCSRALDAVKDYDFTKQTEKLNEVFLHVLK